ncbi:MAG: hypothetical protein IT462_15285 [Planctomycetes bacterium]|nr:hypothetical protein [Planctomycetota bacterium]
MREVVNEELAASRKILGDRDEKVAAFIDAASDPVLLLQSLSSRLGVFISRDEFEGEMQRRFESDVLSGNDIEAELNACAARVRGRWQKILDGLADELKSTDTKLPQEVRGSLQTPALAFNSTVTLPAIQRQLQRAAVLAGSFALAPGLAGASVKLLSLVFDAGKWLSRWSSVLKAGTEIVFTIMLDQTAESTHGLREGAKAQTKQLITQTLDDVFAETSSQWNSTLDEILAQFASAAKGGGQ